MRPSDINSKNVLKLISAGMFYLFISHDIASRLFGSKLWIYSTTFSIAAALVAQVLERKQVMI